MSLFQTLVLVILWLCRHITYSDSGEKTFGYVGDDDTNQEDNSFQWSVVKTQGDDEEGNTKEDSNTCSLPK